MNAPQANHRVAGLLLLSHEGGRLDEWHPRRTEEIERFELGHPMDGSHELRGPSASHPKGTGEGAPGFRSSQQRDLYEQRLELHRIAFSRTVAARCVEVARERGWRFVLVLGDPHLTGPAAAVLRKGGLEVEESARLLGWMRHAQLASAVGPEVEEALLAHTAR
jgi:hypothetical protein